MSEPSPVGVGLVEARAALERRRPIRPINEDEVDDARAELALDRARLRWEACCPGRFLMAAVDDFADEPDVRDSLDEWSAAPPGNLVLFGPVGAGKSHAACAAVRPAVEAGRTMLFLPADELLDRLFSRSDTAALESVVRPDVLIIDDLGSEPLSEWGMSRIYAVTNRRWLEELVTVVTTNADPTDEQAGLAAIIGPRTFSRLVGGALVLRISGDDRRRRKAAK